MPGARRAALRALLAAPAALAAAGCGFKLRGAEALPFRTFYPGVPAGSPFGAELRRAVRLQGATVVDRRDDAQVRFELLGEALERDITALSISGRPREYQVRLRVRWQARDAAEADLVGTTELTLRRPITAIDAQGVVSQDEEAALVRDMRADAVRQILRRLSTVKVDG
jgi:LPS-assembly lipoprotein